MEQNKNTKSAIRLPIFIVMAISLGILIGANMTSPGTSMAGGVFKSVQKFRQILMHIETDYVDEVETDALVEGAITEMLSKLDPHSVYIPAEEMELTKSQLEGNFEGIGIEFNIFNDTIHVVTALSGGPSESLGLRSGDKIVKVDGENVAGVGITSRGVVTKLRGPKGSKVAVDIKRKAAGELLSFTITRDVIPQYSLDVSYMINEEVGYIKINRFSATTYMEFKEALHGLKKQGMQNLVLDLTQNPGGYMNPAVKLVDELIAGREMIVYTKGKELRHNTEYWSERQGDFEDGAIIVLIDQGSASASEIVSGALQDHDRALVVGRRSYGKGLVQMPIELDDGSAMRLTISRYYTPSGRCIQKPYEESPDEYHKEYYERFENGEIFNADSIKVNDSLTYTTDKGRMVYGGGGIIPDVFVPLDSSKNSRYLTRLFNSNTIQQFSLGYFEQNSEQFKKWKFEAYREEFQVSDEILAGLIQLGEENGVALDEEDFSKSKGIIANYLKAYIARSAWGNDGFFPVFNEQNEILLEALGKFDEARALMN